MARRLEETAALSQRSLTLTPVQTVQGEMDMRAVEENFQRIRDYLQPFGGGDPSIQSVASLVGGQALYASVTSSTSGLGTNDTAVPHGLGRVPNYVLFYVDTGGLGGAIMARSLGGIGASGGNQTAWTRDTIYVRASVDSTYAMVVI